MKQQPAHTLPSPLPPPSIPRQIVLGELEPASGEVKRAGRLRMGRFTQHHVDQLDLSKSALDSFLELSPSTPPLEIRKHLGQMGMGGPEALQKMGTLSGGQKSRVAFAQIMWQVVMPPSRIHRHRHVMIPLSR